MNEPQFRIVEKYSGFFSQWYFELEKKTYHKWFWLFPYELWEYVAGGATTTRVPDNWSDFNIIETIKIKP